MEHELDRSNSGTRSSNVLNEESAIGKVVYCDARSRNLSC